LTEWRSDEQKFGEKIDAVTAPSTLALRRGAVAQLAERRLCKPKVAGSIPVRSTSRRIAAIGQRSSEQLRVRGMRTPARQQPVPVGR
jgi:hypothetical protein